MGVGVDAGCWSFGGVDGGIKDMASMVAASKLGKWVLGIGLLA